MKKCGIYGIINKEQKKVYIGKSNDIERRWKEHKLKLSNGTHHNKALQESYDNYGADAFIYEVLELVPESQFSLVELEYINKYAKKGKAFNVYGDKDELRYRLAIMMRDDLGFNLFQIDELMNDCLSIKGNPLKIAVYGLYEGDEVYIHLYSKDFEQTDVDTRYLYCNENWDKHYFEVGYSKDERMNINMVVYDLKNKIKKAVGWKDGNSEEWQD